MNCRVERQLAQRAQRGERIVFFRQELQLSTYPAPADGVQRAGLDRLRRQLSSVRLDREPQAARVAGQAQQSRGVVDEAVVVKDAQTPCLEVLERVRGGRQRPCLAT